MGLLVGLLGGGVSTEFAQSLGTIVDLPKSSKPALQPGKPHPPLGLLLDDLAGLRMATPMHPDRSF